MGKIVVTAFTSADGVVESPEKWSFPYWNDRIEQFKNEELASSEAQLLGRKTYEIFADAWPSRTGYYADRLNRTDKYVVSGTLERAQWRNTEVLAGGDRLNAEIGRLKSRYSGDLLVHGSHTLVQSLVRQGQADEYRMLVYPLMLGEGRRMFESGRADLELVRSTEMGGGVVLLIYRRSAA
ncbi:dihydrofolate reductase family protein [Lysobacter sp. K5869]|uniref:dihydrofolate reductase family protein n=1 Tax=Lysobacter sp. K5869 TaxID=2820808 RepID=UPI001C0621C7|nr:dihydrofolate reductase family protein [Lysobacter sp. K5869]QWP75359.1 dihydrofolate reductase family protein [Lysobacter sp. K5869]